VEVDTQEAALKAEIKALFAKVKEAHREQVLATLSRLQTNEKRLSYLKGWFRLGD
jgi:uncharacterized membrane protein (DUF106 family)